MMREPTIRCRSLLLSLLPLVLACSDGTGPEDQVYAVITGQAHAPGAAPLSTLTAVWRSDDGTIENSAALDEEGRFDIEVTSTESSGELLIRDDGDAYHPFLFPFEVQELEDVDVVMVPRSWTIQRGTHEGETVDTSLDPVVEDKADQFLYSYFFGQPFPRDAPEIYLLDLMLWDADQLPARVAFDHPNETAEITPTDSAAIWGVLDRIEEVTGVDYFEPAEADPTWWPEPTGPYGGDRIEGVIRLIHHPPNWSGLGLSGAEPVDWERDLGGWVDRGRFDAVRVSRTYLDAGNVVIGELEPLQLADGLVPWETVLTHEVMHVLGVGHTCRIPSPMGPCDRTAEPSAYDVAYMELLRSVLELQEEWGTELGMMPAIIGERRVLLGESALPEVTSQDAP
jgi:hypothetical protein